MQTVKLNFITYLLQIQHPFLREVHPSFRGILLYIRIKYSKKEHLKLKLTEVN